jgi:hypothetical protein
MAAVAVYQDKLVERMVGNVGGRLSSPPVAAHDDSIDGVEQFHALQLAPPQPPAGFPMERSTRLLS